MKKDKLPYTIALFLGIVIGLITIYIIPNQYEIVIWISLGLLAGLIASIYRKLVSQKHAD